MATDQQLLGWRGASHTLDDKKIVILDHYGPTSYTAITPGTAPAQPTGGDSVTAAACSLNLIEAVIVLGDSSGHYTGTAFPPVASTATSPLAGQGGGAKTVPLMWQVAATGAEVAGATNLSTFALRLICIGD